MITRFPARVRRHASVGAMLILITAVARPAIAKEPLPASADSIPGAQTQPANDGTAEEKKAPSPAVDEKLQRQLDRVLPEVSFDAVGLSDVIDFLRDVSGAEIFVNWKSLQTAGIDRNTPVTARLRNIKLSKVLRVILDSVGGAKAKAGYVVDEGVITICTVEDLSRNVIVRVYDIRDLLVAVPDFVPNGARNESGPTTQPTAAPASRPSFPPSREELIKNLTQLIEDTVGPDSWKERGGSTATIRELQGQLIVTQTAENQALLAALLAELREARSVQIVVEARFISCEPKLAADVLADLKRAGAATTRPAVADQPASRQLEDASGIYLDQPQVERFIRVTSDRVGSCLVTAPRMTLFSGQRAYAMVSNQRAYVSSYNTVRAATGDLRYEPAISVSEAGLVLDVRATASADRHSVIVTLKPKVSAIVGIKETPWNGRPANSNLVVQEPQIKSTELETTVEIPTDRSLLLAGLSDPGLSLAPATQPALAAAIGTPRTLFLLIKPRVIVISRTP